METGSASASGAVEVRCFLPGRCYCCGARAGILSVLSRVVRVVFAWVVLVFALDLVLVRVVGSVRV